MGVIFHIKQRTRHLDIILKELQSQTAITRYEISESRHEVKIEPFNAQAIFRIGVLLGQLPEVRDTVISSFKEHRGKIKSV